MWIWDCDFSEKKFVRDCLEVQGPNRQEIQQPENTSLFSRGLESSDDLPTEITGSFLLMMVFGLRCSGRQIVPITYVEEDLEFCQLD